jgi:ABC-type multidrug transport system fused ATPase/permease subunit
MVLATHTIQTSLSLGTIHLCQALGQDIKSILDTLIDRVCAAYQVPFLLAGLFSAADGPETIRVLEDFEAHRVPGGMRIEARGLTYTYGSGKQILRGIDLVVEPGESLAVVGLNGSGKTTLVKTLLGLNNHEGEVLVNGRSITEYTPESVHARMSCLFQNYGKYDISLRDNVGLGDTTRITDDSAITLAIDRAGAGAMRDELGLDVWLVAHLPSATFKKFSHLLKPLTPLEDAEVPSPKMAVEEPKTEVEGTAEGETEEAETASEEDSFTGGLSGGQWQRIALARAFMRAGSADLIVFDEPSASLDPRAEAELFESIHALSHTGTGATTLFITHRMNTVRRADKIAFMEKGVSVVLFSVVHH